LEVPSVGDGLTGLINITHIPLHLPSLKTKRSDYADDLIFTQNLAIRSITVRSMRDDWNTQGGGFKVLRNSKSARESEDDQEKVSNDFATHDLPSNVFVSSDTTLGI
jgi:hypothetical protein